MKHATLAVLLVAGSVTGACARQAARDEQPSPAPDAQVMEASPEPGLDSAAAPPPAFGSVPAPRPVARTASRAPAPAAQKARPAPAREDRVERVEADDQDWPAEERPAEEEPEPVLTLPAGTELRLVLENGLSSENSQVGDPVTARVERATADDGSIVLPGGTVVKGRVTEARASGRVKGRARLAVSFDQIVVRGRSHRLDATDVAVEAASGAKKDAATIGGAAALGAIIGGIADGGKGAKKGVLLGGAAGTGAVLATRGKDVELPAGSRWTVRVSETVRF